MNNEQANKVKHLALGVMKVLEGLEWVCPECGGTGKAQVFIENRDKNPAIDGKCPECIGMKKIPYSWTPQVGEWCIHPLNTLILITTVKELELRFQPPKWVLQYAHMNIVHEVGDDECVPILDWQEIERALEKAGYYFEEPIKRVYGSEGSKCHCVIKKKGNLKPEGMAWGDSRQQVVMLAIIELGKEKER